MGPVKVKDIVAYIHKIANPGLAMDWDNVGLQLGEGEQEVNRVLLALDVTDAAVEKAIKENADLIISHHPFIFKPINKITNPLYLKLIRNNISVFCAHTNLDVVKQGVNFALAEKLGLSNLEFISSETGSSLYHIAVYVPKGNMDAVAEAAFSAGAGIIGDYSNCANHYAVKGQFMPLAGSNPTIGKQNKLEQVHEQKLELFADSFNLNKIINAIKKVHPYETPAYAVYPQEKKSENYGLGLIGELEEKISLKDFASLVKNRLQAPYVKLWPGNKNKDAFIKKVAVCGGNGSSLISQIYGRADVYVSGDFTYHTVLGSKIPLIDAGHFYTENPVLDNLADMLSDFNLEVIKLNIDEHEINKEIII